MKSGMALRDLIAQLRTEAREFTPKQARRLGDEIGVDWGKVDAEQFRLGLGVESEHDDDSDTDVVGPKTDLGKIALAHLRELPDYYTRLKKMEREAKRKR